MWWNSPPKHHNLLEPSKIQQLPSQKSSVWWLAPPEVFLLTKHEYLILPASVVLGILVITIIHTGKSVINNSISPHHVAQAWWLVDEHMPYIAFRSLVHRWMVQFSTVESWKTTHPGDDPSKSMRRTHDVWVFYGESCLQIDESPKKSHSWIYFLQHFLIFMRHFSVSPRYPQMVSLPGMVPSGHTVTSIFRGGGERNQEHQLSSSWSGLGGELNWEALKAK